ncbi:MAG: hypothetical protein K0R15_1466 [Clostridiales bacterium]|jgi:hypothetical protein|nr:hypothetical protein [Clostridiales bacterium]
MHTKKKHTKKTHSTKTDSTKIHTTKLHTTDYKIPANVSQHIYGYFKLDIYIDRYFIYSLIFHTNKHLY